MSEAPLKADLVLSGGGVKGIGLVGAGWDLLSGDGLYKGDFALQWIRSELANLGVASFGDLAFDDEELPPQQRYRLVVTTAARPCSKTWSPR
jgi:NTE family protein